MTREERIQAALKIIDHTAAARQRASSRMQPQPGDRDLIQQYPEWRHAAEERAKIPQHRNKYDRYR